MAWRVANSLLTLRDQFNAKFPGRNKASDGTIGDPSHQGTDSDHNPWYGGIVTAIDITHDPAHGVDIDRITDELQASRDPRIKYVIANGLIMDTRPQFNPWQWVRYTGDNPHTSHFHLSVVASPLCDDPRPWNLPILGGASTQPPTRPPTKPRFPLPEGHYFGLITGPNESHGGAPESMGGIPNEQYYVRLIQEELQRLGFAPNYPGWADGIFEQPTADAVSAWQRAYRPNSTSRWGEVWWDDWADLIRP
ncbi:peptidoglycan-binding domain-containing protein [Lentzea aerocolonigenes]|uniref:peptidoglycan-binding domain-containing protein n=1 Tax=Lentzea aerocolonigenes TaxID=68170 RepID=UPI00068DDC4F|nr:peptidoglycan-binding domain-containing protein [Lentzea aerocolonigenes]MCP2248197.1 putative peptidoglycan binding domain-containing protein [Lentzea aerocolonigenes]